MPKKAKELSALAVKRLSEPGMHAVGGVSGLYLNITPSGARSWILRYATPEVRYSRSGKPYHRRRDVGLGGYPEVTLAMARERARELKERIREGVDPVEERKAAREALMPPASITFDEAARAYLDGKRHEFRNPKHARQWESTLTTYASPVIGKMPVDRIELQHVVSILKPIWTTKSETASRLRGRLENVLAWATVSGYRSGENPARWKGNLDAILPRPSRVKKPKHHRALPWKEVPHFVGDLREREGMAARALEFIILTAARSVEVRAATWEEIDLEARLWTVPGDRIKAGKRHRVPLSEDAAALLEALPRFEGSPYILPGPRGGVLSDVGVSKVIQRIGADCTVHGFRSSFKDWARSVTAYPDEVSELALAHVNSDATRAAYARDELLPQRARLMADWARFCREGLPEGAEVVGIGEARE